MTSYITSELNKTTENNPGQKKKKKPRNLNLYHRKGLKSLFLKKKDKLLLSWAQMNTEQPGFDPKAKLHSFHIKIFNYRLKVVSPIYNVNNLTG